MGLILSVGPWAFYDTSASARSEQGARISYRLRGMENIVRAVEDVKRAISLGVPSDTDVMTWLIFISWQFFMASPSPGNDQNLGY